MAGDFEDSGFDRFKDLQVTRAAAEISGECFADLVARWMRILVEQSFRGNENGWSAIAALRGAEISESFLQRMQCAVRAQTLYGLDFSSVAFDGQKEARENRFAIEEDSAGAAFAEFATMFCARVVEIFTEHFEQRFVRGERDVGLFAV